MKNRRSNMFLAALAMTLSVIVFMTLSSTEKSYAAANQFIEWETTMDDATGQYASVPATVSITVKVG